MNRLSFIKGIITSLLLLNAIFLFADTKEIYRIEPPNWWVNMHHSDLQLLVYGDELAGCRVAVDYPGVQLRELIQVENPNYLFLNLRIGKEAKAGIFTIRFYDQEKLVAEHEYELKNREPNSCRRSGFDASDAIYLLMPDRFANGNMENDSHPKIFEKADRSDHDGRHGGDLEGIRKHLNYIQESGFTALWLNPFLENNQPKYSYHGYAISDFYNTDPRMGSNSDFKQLVDEAHDKGIKVIMDMIFNHCGSGHWWVNDLPMQDWFHQHKEFTRSNFRAGTITDPNASDYDREKMLSGWFDTNMPDLNQDNPFLAKYLIQNSIWWVEYAGLDGIRMDTQPYPDKTFMSDWAAYVLEEYPEFSIVGEVWIDKPSMVSYYLGDAHNFDGYNSHLPHVFDFPLYYAISQGFNEKDGWTEGLTRIYELLSQDFLYSRPEELVVFMDNHDLNRIFTSFGEDMNKLKMAMTFVATVRGIPMFYYGTEIAMTGLEHEGHGHIRKDFPGGWGGDKRSAFTAEGRTKVENEAYEHLKQLLTWRKNSKPVIVGKFKHFIPENGIYVYFRYTNDEVVMVAINNNDTEMKLNTDRFSEVLNDYSSGQDVINNKTVDICKDITLKPMSATILELKK